MLKRLVLKFNSKSVSFKWITSYFLLIALFVISMTISISCFYSAQKSETMRSGNYILNIAEKDFEHFFSDAMDVINMTLTQTPENIYSYIPDSIDDYEKEYKYSKMMSQLNKMIQGNECYERVYMYLEDFDIIVSTVNVMDTELYYKASLPKSGAEEYKNWKKLISTDTLNSVVPFKHGDEIKYFYVAKTAISLSNRCENVSLVFVMNNNYVESICRNIFETNEAEVLMNDGRTVINFSKNIPTGDFNAKNVYSIKSSPYVKVNGKKYVYMATDNTTGRNYMLLIPMRSFYGNLITTVAIQLVMLIIISLIMAMMAIWFSKLHLSPVEELMFQLNSERKTVYKNEYDEIKSRISDLITKKNSIEQKMMGQNKYFYKSIVTRWLNGDITVSEFDEHGVSLETFGFKGSKYVVLVFEITDIGFFSGGKDNSDDYEIAEYALNNVMSELINEKYYCYSTDADGLLTFIANPSEEVSDKKIRQELSDIYKNAKDFILKNLSFDFKMAVGFVKSDPDELHYSYGEAVSLLEYNIASGGDDPLPGSVPELYANAYGMLSAETNMLVHKIKNGKDDEIETQIQKWCKMYVACRAKNPNVMQYGLYGLIDSVLRECMAFGASIDEVTAFSEYLAGKYRFENTKSYERIKSKLSDMIFEIRRFAGDRKDANRIEDRVMHYIEENYSDGELSVAKIAEHFNLNVAYLSSVFKKATGVGMLEKINRLRCDKSAELLIRTQKNISKIAADVGYDNVHTYIRAFKKYYSITPTQYRSKRGRK